MQPQRETKNQTQKYSDVILNFFTEKPEFHRKPTTHQNRQIQRRKPHET
jgi:hypothetical protein